MPLGHRTVGRLPHVDLSHAICNVSISTHRTHGYILSIRTVHICIYVHTEHMYSTVQYETYLHQIDMYGMRRIRIIVSAAQHIHHSYGVADMTQAERIIAERYCYAESWQVAADATCVSSHSPDGDIVVFDFADGSSIVWRGVHIDCIQGE
jgi:hypothetical protein